ncbi:hypothetical protein OBA40_08140 [Alphaproteobacteria bacterium]|nr:hypothetical protein [Alphaproteobacteria bacterium]
MKFLIFNIMVLGCLGYLLMAEPNENFLQWASSTKEKVSQLSKDDFLRKINAAVNSKDIKSSEKAENKEVSSKKNEIIDMVKLELSKYDKKLENTLKTFSIKEQNKKEKKKNENEVNTKKPLINLSKENHENKKNQSNQFMSKTDRTNALAELITDMELYGLENLNK